MANGEEQRTLPAEIGETKKECSSGTNKQVIAPGASQKEEKKPQNSNSL